MSNSISYGLCARACTYLSLYIDGDCSAAHVYIFIKGAISEKFEGSLGIRLMTVMITKMGEGSTSGTVIIRRNLPGMSLHWSRLDSNHDILSTRNKNGKFLTMGGGTFWRDGLHPCCSAIYTADHTKVGLGTSWWWSKKIVVDSNRSFQNCLMIIKL